MGFWVILRTSAVCQTHPVRINQSLAKHSGNGKHEHAGCSRVDNDRIGHSSCHISASLLSLNHKSSYFWGNILCIIPTMLFTRPMVDWQAAENTCKCRLCLFNLHLTLRARAVVAWIAPRHPESHRFLPPFHPPVVADFHQLIAALRNPCPFREKTGRGLPTLHLVRLALVNESLTSGGHFIRITSG